MNQLLWHDLNWCLRRAPAKVLRMIEKYPYGTVIISGGFMRACIANEAISDIDLFVPSGAVALEVANLLAPDQDRAKNDKGALPGVHTTENAYTIPSVKPVAQVIHRWTFNTAQECIDSFDFTICQAAIWFDGQKWQSTVSDRFYPDLAAKRLIYTSPKRIEEAGGSMLRVLKFYQRGYRIPLDSLAAVIARLTSAVDWEEIKKHPEMEAQSAKVMLGLLREVDPNVDPTHAAHLPSETERQAAEKDAK